MSTVRCRPQRILGRTERTSAFFRTCTPGVVDIRCVFVSQYTTVYHSTPQYVTVYHSYHSISQYITVYHSTPQYITVYHSYHSIPQYTTVYHSIPQYVTVYHSISRILSISQYITTWFILQYTVGAAHD